MSRTNRRNFLKTSAAIGAGYWALGGIAPRESLSANETINFASIGVGGKGDSDSADAGRNGNMVAICDIDDNQLNRAATKWQNAKKYHDFRKMFDEMGKSIDAITVSTPDHCHGVASVDTAFGVTVTFEPTPAGPTTCPFWAARETGMTRPSSRARRAVFMSDRSDGTR